MAVRRSPQWSSEMREDLIYDVGMHNGDDTAYYLSRGFRVVAIEANPELIAQANVRFSGALRAGTLTMLHVGIGPREEVATFWINDLKTEWSSFIKEVGCRDGTPCHPVAVPCTRLGHIFTQHGVPFYLKIDIEGHDRSCLEDIDPTDAPTFVSVEAHSPDYLSILARAGYDAFKLISQTWFTQPGPRRLSSLGRTGRGLLRRLAQIRPIVLGRWVFPRGSSGPFGEQSEGPWRSLEETTAMWRALPQDDWFDFHATRGRDLGRRQ